jgi:hypothetical protein
MDFEQEISIPFADRDKQQQTKEPQFDGRRQYKREYMRRWRTDPGHLAHERGKRKEWYHDRKSRGAQQNRSPSPSDCGEPVCGFCRLRPSLKNVMRLQICDSAPGGYVKVRIPYCGQC